MPPPQNAAFCVAPSPGHEKGHPYRSAPAPSSPERVSPPPVGSLFQGLGSGFVYRNVGIYRLVMRLLYRADYAAKYRVVAELVPQGSTVVDLCAGDCRLAEHLKGRSSHYTALELNPCFVSWAQRAGIDARVCDVRQEEIPAADVVCLQSSLYQFIPDDEKLVRRMLQSARQLVIISEPVINVTNSPYSLLSRFAVRATAVEGVRFPARHSLQSLTQMLHRIDPHAELVGRPRRDAILMLRKNHEPDFAV